MIRGNGMTKLRVGVIGCGYWGSKLILRFATALDTRVYAAADLSKARLEEVRAQYPQIVTTTRPQEIFECDDIEAVAICTPVHTHFELARAAIMRRKHVFIEKPMTDSVETSERLIEMADEAGVTLMVDHTFVYSGAVRKMREFVEQGELGKLYYFDSVRTNAGLFRRDVSVVWDLAPHDVSIMEHVLREDAIAVAAHGAASLGHKEKPIEDIAYLTVYYPEDLIAHIHVNWLAPVKTRRAIVGGFRKMIEYDDTEATEKIQIYDRIVETDQADGRENLHATLGRYTVSNPYAPALDSTEPLQAAVDHFVRCAETGEKPATDGLAGLNVVRILEAAQRSLDNGGARVDLRQVSARFQSA